MTARGDVNKALTPFEGCRAKQNASVITNTSKITLFWKQMLLKMKISLLFHSKPREKLIDRKFADSKVTIITDCCYYKITNVWQISSILHNRKNHPSAEVTNKWTAWGEREWGCIYEDFLKRIGGPYSWVKSILSRFCR